MNKESYRNGQVHSDVLDIVENITKDLYENGFTTGTHFTGSDMVALWWDEVVEVKVTVEVVRVNR